MRLAVPVKMISQRFALPVLVFASVVMVVLGKADALLFERIRVVFADIVSPVLGIVSQPVAAVDHVRDRLQLLRQRLPRKPPHRLTVLRAIDG